MNIRLAEEKDIDSVIKLPIFAMSGMQWWTSLIMVTLIWTTIWLNG